MVRRYLEETGIPKVTGRDDHLGETFCKWDLGIEAGTLPNSRWHFCLRPCLHYQDWQPLLFAKVISTLEPTCHSHHHLVTYYGFCQFLQHPSFWVHAQVGVLYLSELGSIRRAAALVLLLSAASVWCLREGAGGGDAGHMGPREPAGGLEGELQRLSNGVIRERARSAGLTALRACSDTAFSNRKKIHNFCCFPLL